VKRALAIAGLGAAVLAGVGALAWRAKHPSGPRTAPVVREDFRSLVDATGRLEAAVFYEIGPPSVAGQWDYNLTWMIPDGSRVKQGDVVARFDATTLQEQLREHQATLATTMHEREKEQRNLDVEVRQLQLDLVKAEGDLEAVDVELELPEGLVSSLEIERTRLERDLAQRKLAFLREKIGFKKELVASKLELLDVKRAFAEAKIAYAEGAIAKYEVKAPVGGLVVHMTKGRGERWEVGESVWMMAKVLKVADTTTLRAEAAVLEVDAARIAVGQVAEIRVDALPGVPLSSRIAEIGRIVHEKSLQDPTKVFDAMIPVEGAESQLRPGMGIHVDIETARLPGALTIPLEAVKLGDDGPYVEIVEGGTRVRRAITLGPRDATRVVVEAGVSEGERVALAPSGDGESGSAGGPEVARAASGAGARS
jgi:RND family efflux transporter MFP subunit